MDSVLLHPARYTGSAALNDGGVVSVRPISPQDEAKMVRFHQALSESSVYYRYAGFMKLDSRVAHQRLSRICSIEDGREMVLVAERGDEIVAVARLVRLVDAREAEFALLVSDALQGQGLGHALLKQLLEVGRDWGLSRIVAEISPDNVPMRRVCRELGFTFHGKTGASKDLAA